jgi:hypothetical protein
MVRQHRSGRHRFAGALNRLKAQAMASLCATCYGHPQRPARHRPRQVVVGQTILLLIVPKVPQGRSELKNPFHLRRWTFACSRSIKRSSRSMAFEPLKGVRFCLSFSRATALNGLIARKLKLSRGTELRASSAMEVTCPLPQLLVAKQRGGEILSLGLPSFVLARFAKLPSACCAPFSFLRHGRTLVRGRQTISP